MITWNSAFFHSPSSLLAELVIGIHDYVMIFLFTILIGVLLILTIPFLNSFYDLNYFEDHQLEFLWTVGPFFLLFFIILPSLNSLYMLDTCFFCGLTLNIIGHQWYWSYFYKDIGGLLFDSYILPSDSSNIRLLEVDNRVIVPTFMPLRFLVSSSDVIHSWTIPSFGVKIDALPGRINQFCFLSKRRGVYFGQCSEICGANHRFMPIVIESVVFKDFISSIWLYSL